MKDSWRQIWIMVAGMLLAAASTSLLAGANGSVLHAAASETMDFSSNSRSPVLLVLGDSISAGYGLEPQQGWVWLLQQRLQQNRSGYRVINASISGDTTSGGLRRLPLLLQQYQPDILLIELGANDGLRGTPLAVIDKNLQRLISMGQQAGARVLLLGMRIPPNYGPRYSGGFYRLFESVATRTDIAYLPFLLDGVGGVSELMQADGLHPNQPAQAVLLDNVWSVLEPVI